VLDNSDLKSGIDHREQDDAVPLPATMIHDLGALFTDDGQPVRLYSPYPFPNRKTRQLDQFAQDAWRYLSTHPNDSYHRVEWIDDNNPVVRVAIPDRLDSQICVDCHNGRSDSPKRDWQLNDVRGIMEIEIPIATHLAGAYERILGVVVVGLLAVLVLILSLLLNIRRRARLQEGLELIIEHSSDASFFSSTQMFLGKVSDHVSSLFPVRGEPTLVAATAGRRYKDLTTDTSLNADDRLMSSLDLAEREKRSVVQNRTGILFFKWEKGIDRLAIFNSSRRLNRLDENLLSIYTRNVGSAMEQIEQLKMQETLETARKIQMAMMPTNFAEFSNRFGIDLHAYLSPANEVGGDLYDFFELDDGHICLALGDVSDKGVPAALFMTMAKTLIRHVAKTDISPSEVLTQVNNELCRDNDECMFVTLFLAFFDCRTGTLVYANGGHNPPYLIRSNEQLECLDQQPGVPLGTFEAMPYRDYITQLEKGDGLFVFSDGINEAMNSEEQPFGTERMEATLVESGGLDAQTSILNMIESVKAFTEAAPQSDDMTILYLKNSAG
jgi:hypothetical protein